MFEIPSIKLPIISNGKIENKILSQVTANKKIIIFGVPGVFTSTCSEKHLPSFLNLTKEILDKGVNDIYCISVNDAFVMKAWLKSYSIINEIKGIADGNVEFAKIFNLQIDYSSNYMGVRCKRFSLIAENNLIKKINIEKPGEFFVSSAEYILEQI